MGNAPHEIGESTLEGEKEIIEEFLTLEQEGKQVTWMMRYDSKTIGAAWIELIENHGVQPPSIHIMIGDKSYRGKGIGKATMKALIDYIKSETNYDTIYSRHLKNNVAVDAMNHSLGFTSDGKPYTDENGLEWQNIIMPLDAK
jgi:RimJ/RimL family protein N-acetyltransferase